jgi:hypothetical protein
VNQVDIDNEPHRISSGEGPVTRKLRHKFREIASSDAIPED